MNERNRYWFPGALYHVTDRGNHKQDIFLDDDDRLTFFDMLRYTIRKYPFSIHSFTLMTNHYHMMIQTQNVPIGQIMGYVNSWYAKNFNEKYHQTGHLFQGRFKSRLITSDVYCLNVFRYIHRNPLKAGIVSSLEDYKWSSYRTYAGLDNLDFITTDYGLGFFPATGREGFCRAMNGDYDDEYTRRSIEAMRLDLDEDRYGMPV